MPFILRHKHKKKGMALLASVLILSALMLGFIILENFIFMEESQTVTALLNKKNAEVSAIGCAEYALEQLGLSSDYAGNETIAVDSSSCFIRPIVSNGEWTVTTESQYRNQHARFQITVSSLAPITVSSWQEIGQ